MGYQINSPWRRLHKNDIEKLNKIIDNENYQEKEIALKLKIMEVFEDEFNEALQQFNFDVVLKFMNDNDWKWSFYKRGISYEAVPTKEEMIESIRKDHFEEALYEIIECGKNQSGSSSGGIVFDMGYISGTWPSKDNVWVTICFDIASF